MDNFFCYVFFYHYYFPLDFLYFTCTCNGIFKTTSNNKNKTYNNGYLALFLCFLSLQAVRIFIYDSNRACVLSMSTATQKWHSLEVSR